MADNFNYDGDDGELDDNGLPKDVITDDESNGEEAPESASAGEIASDIHDTYKNVKKVKDLKKAKDTAKTAKDAAETAQKAKQTAEKIKKAKQTAEKIEKIKKGKKAVDTIKTLGKRKSIFSVIMGSLPYSAIVIGIILLIIIILIVITVLISSLIAAIDSKASDGALMNNSHITNECFYGIRTAYLDEQMLINSLQLSYKKYCIDLLVKLEENEIDIVFDLPTNIDNSTDVNLNITNLSLSLANVVANNSTNYAGFTFASLYNEIDYFGLTKQQSDMFNDFLSTYLAGGELAKDANSNSALNKNTIKNKIDKIFDNPDSDIDYMFNLCEKVMIKDFISDPSGIQGLVENRYVGSIYMANKSITISNNSYIRKSLYNDKTSSIKLVEVNDMDELILLEKNFNENSEEVELVAPSNNKSVTLDKFTSIDENNLQLFSEGLSLFDAIKLLDEEQEYFKQIEISNNGTTVTVYTWKPADEKALYLEFSSNNPFMYGEFDIKVA